MLTLVCGDRALAMTVARKNANFLKKKDSEIAASLVGHYAGLTAEVQTTKNELPDLVQYYCTDWDFLLARAGFNGYVVTVEGGRVSFKPPRLTQAALLKLTWGEDLLAFDGHLEAQDQFAQVVASAWDARTQKVIHATAKPSLPNSAGPYGSAALAKALALPDGGVQTPTALSHEALKTWAAGQQLQSELARLRGTMKFQGSALAEPDTRIQLVGISDVFDGEVYLSAVTHEIADGNWVVNAEFGLPPQSATHATQEAPPAAGLQPGFSGLQIGVVKQITDASLSQVQVLVEVPIMQTQSEGVWARLAQFQASKGSGAFFLPEVGDEVVVGYLNSDPSAPVVLGSLYSSNRPMPYTPTPKNATKAIRTVAGLTLQFDEENKTITLETPAHNTIVIDDKDKSILLRDQTGNTVKLSESGITLDSSRDINLRASGNIALNATGAVSIAATQDAKMTGLNVSHSAQVSFTAKGNASAELSASGQTTVKGAIVMIN